MDAFWSLTFPPLARRPNGLRFVHPILVAAVLVGLFLLQRGLRLERQLRSPWPHLHPYWLPALGGLIYLVGRLSFRFRRWTTNRDATAPPNGWNEAWSSAASAMARASANWRNRPIYLVLGRTSAALEHLIAAGYEPAPEQAPLGIPWRVWSRNDSILVCASELDHESAFDRGRRFAALAQLVARHNEPRLPFEGAMVFLALESLGSPDEARTLGERLRRDVQNAADAVGQDMPVAAVVLDAERLSGFEAWAAANEKGSDVWGVRFGNADAAPMELGSSLAQAVDRFCQDQGPKEIRRWATWQEDTEKSTRRNRELFRLAGALPGVAPLLGAFVNQFAYAETADPPPLVGLFLAGTRNEPGATAFLAGIAAVLQEKREFAGWTYRTIEEDWLFRRLTRWAMGGAGMAAALMAAGLWTLRRL